jgi:hypothetical protein
MCWPVKKVYFSALTVVNPTASLPTLRATLQATSSGEKYAIVGLQRQRRRAAWSEGHKALFLLQAATWRERPRSAAASQAARSGLINWPPTSCFSFTQCPALGHAWSDGANATKTVRGQRLRWPSRIADGQKRHRYQCRSASEKLPPRRSTALSGQASKPLSGAPKARGLTTKARIEQSLALAPMLIGI